MRKASDQLHRTANVGLRPSRSWPLPVPTLAVLLLAVVTFLGVFPGVVAVAQAQQADGAISGLTLTTDSPGTLVVSWNAPSPAPSDYRMSWAPVESDYLSWTEDNETDRGNAYPAGAATSRTLSGLSEGTEFKVQVRARYHHGADEDRPWSGSWAEARALVMSQPSLDSSAPAAPSVVGTALTPAGHVMLFWQDPSDDSITGYQVLRGPDADSLVVIEHDTGSSGTTYTDTEPPAGQTHTYAVKARSAAGLRPLSNTVTATVPASESKEELVAAQQHSCPDTLPERTPSAVQVDAVPIVVESTTADYFVLYVKHDLNGTDVEVPVLVKKGAAGTTTLAENIEALPKERYRLEKYLIAEPADVDGDCIDDITELDDTAGNPVNPATAIELSDGAVTVPDQETLETLSYEYRGKMLIKFVLIDMDHGPPAIYFVNLNTPIAHFDFMDAVGLDRNQDELVFGTIRYDPDVSPGSYYFWLGPSNTYYSVARMEYFYTLLAASMPLLEDNLAVYMANSQLRLLQSNLLLYSESRIPLVFNKDIFPEISFLALNPGEGYGLLRLMELEDRPNPRDIVIYEALPNELPRVAGVISTVPQTPLTHVNLRAVQDRIPNAFIRDGLNKVRIASLRGKYVHYTVTETGWILRGATRAEVDDHYASSRPTQPQTPERDLSFTAITPLSQIDFDDWDAFGVKAANVAVLGTLAFPEGTVPDGFAIPFYFYDEFMKHNDFYTRIETMLADPDFQTDYAVQDDMLDDLRDDIKDAETPQWIIDALTTMNASFAEGVNRRYRSSTNNEDLPGFNGAGLYDSKSQKPSEDEDDLAKSLKEVYASLWNYRAYIERDFHRVDHLKTAMGILVHPSYQDELANGVAVSMNPPTGETDDYYVNTQLGEDLVTNPEAHSVPEEILLRQNRYTVLATSNLVEPGRLLMSDAQLTQLREHLTTIHDHFERLYNLALNEPFAMEIEFKITSDNVLAIKQARPWVFSDAPTRPPPPIIITDVNEAPVASDDAAATAEDEAVVVHVLDNDRDPENDDLAVIRVTAPQNGVAEVDAGGETITYTPRQDHHGADSFAYTVSDGHLDNQARVSVTIRPLNDAPAFAAATAERSVSENAPPGAKVGFPVIATDVDDDPLTYGLTGAAALGFEIDEHTGQITVAEGAAPNTAQSPYSVTVSADDRQGETAMVEVTITVTAGPVLPPVIIITGGGGGFVGGGGGGGPTPSEVDFEWNVKRDIEELDGGNDRATGVWSDGTTLWVADNADGASDAVYAYDLASGERVEERVEEREFELHETNRAPRGFWSDGEAVWVSDSGRERLFAYDLATGERLEEREFELPRENRDARGIWSDEETMWVLDGRADALFAYDFESGALLGEYELADANGDPRGIWSDRTTVWVSDHGAKRLFAYRLPTPEGPAAEDAEPQDLERVRDEEFSKLSQAGNNSPRGIWSDGDVMYVADESDDKVYSYNMPDAIDVRLASLTLSGVDIGEFDPGRPDYEAVVADGVTETTVEAEAMQPRTDIAIDPPDADGDDANGHQVALQDLGEITVTVTSADGSRMKTYRVQIPETAWDPARDPWPHCLRGAVSEGFSLVVYEGGSVEELVSCAESRDIVTLYVLHEGVYVSYILGAPDFVNAGFIELFPDGLPPITPLVAGSNGPPSADPFGDLEDGGQPWPECLHGAIAAGFSLVVYEGGSVDELEACARSADITALYTLSEGEFVSYILGAPDFVNQPFRELFAEGLPSITPLVARSEGPRLAN